MNVSMNQVWSPKEEPCRANNWKPEEISTLLNTIKANNLMKGYPSSTQLGQLLEPLLGCARTAFQITGKLKNLRKSYLTCEKRGCTPAARRECPYYDSLAAIYGVETRNYSDVKNVDNLQDIKVTSEQGIEKMLDVIKDLNLAKDATPRAFSPSVVRLISKMLTAKGICATTEQVKSALVDLHQSYIEYRKNNDDTKISCKNSRFEILHQLWGTMSITDLLNDNDITPIKSKTESCLTKEKNDYWSDEETIVLLTSIKTLNLRNEASKNTEEAAKKLKYGLSDGGYLRSKYQIQKKLDSLQNDYLNAQRATSLEYAIRKFPFYALYESVFNSSDFCIPDFCTSEAIDELNSRKNHENYDEEDSIPYAEKTKHSRSRSWSEDETIMLLTLLKDLNLARLIAHRLSFEIACKLVEPMRDNGYTRSAMQIQIKLRNLRKSYYRCVRAGFTSSAIADCPFYEKLNEIFRQPRDKKLTTVRKLEPIDVNYVNSSESFTDHSYSNARIDNFREFEKIVRDDSDEDGGENWLPVETICDESIDDSMSVHEEEISGLGSAEPETPTINDNVEASIELDDPPEQSNTKIGNDTGQKKDSKNPHDPNLPNNPNRTTNENCQSPGTSEKLSERLHSSSRSRRSKRKSIKSLSSKSKRDSTTLKSIRIVMGEVLRREKLLQRQHHVWMERQFEIQRKHDREQRELLIQEIREFRKAVTSKKDKIPDDGD